MLTLFTEINGKLENRKHETIKKKKKGGIIDLKTPNPVAGNRKYDN